MRDATTSVAPHRAQRLVAPDVRSGVFRMALNLNRPELEVRPEPAQAAAERAVALGGLLGCRWKREPNRSTVTRAL